MRTVDYSEILHGSAALAGMRPDDLGPTEFALYRTFHDRRLQSAWEIHRWSDLCPTEKRYYRQLWAIATTYAATDERFDVPSGKYFQALRASTGEAPMTAGVENSAYWAECKNGYSASDWADATAYAVGDQVRDAVGTLEFYQCHTAHTSSGTLDLTKFGLLTPFNKFIAYEQTDETAIGEYFTASNKDPRITTQRSEYRFWLSPDGAQFGPDAPNILWLTYRTRRPVLLGDAWDSTGVYSAGQQVYFAATTGGAGNFYTANDTTAAGESPATNPELWDVIELPYFLRGYLLEAGHADWLTSDGQEDKALVHEQLALQYIELEADKLQRQQQQVRRLAA